MCLFWIPFKDPSLPLKPKVSALETAKSKDAAMAVFIHNEATLNAFRKHATEVMVCEDQLNFFIRVSATMSPKNRLYITKL